ncbi:MAG: PPC domain-containing DNA-binding protein [Calditrichia bacterium]
MKSKLLDQSGEKTYLLVFDSGDEVMSNLLNFAKENDLTAGHFTAIGAFKKVVLGYFDMEKKDYHKNTIDEQVEVLTLAGNVARHNGDPKVHAHVVVGKRDGTAHGGHLLKAEVRPTLEVVLSESPEYLQRKIDPKTNLPLISL